MKRTINQTAKRSLKTKKAFTLVELLVVIAIIGILFVVLISKVDFATDKAKTTGVQTDFRSFQLAMKTVGMEQQGFTNDMDDLAAQLNKNLDPKLQVAVVDGKLTTEAEDPWGTAYQFTYGEPANTRGEIVVRSAGPDLQYNTDDDLITITRSELTNNGVQLVAYNSREEAVEAGFDPEVNMFLPPANTALEDFSWSQIAAISEAGKAQQYFSLGDTKVVNENLTVQIVGFDHDDLADGSGKAGISFVAKKSGYSQYISYNPYLYGGWASSDIRGYCNSTIYNDLPSDLKNTIKTVNKLTDNGFDVLTTLWGGSLITTEDKIWIPSITEVGLSASECLAGQGNQYAYYTNNSSRLLSDGFSNSSWWLRSARSNYQAGFRCIDYSGALYAEHSSMNLCVAVGFCV